MENETYDSLVSKLHPNRITGASDQVYYIMSSILNQEWVTHDRGMGMFTETSDHFVVDCGLFLGHIDDFTENVYGYIDVAGLTDSERTLFDGLYSEHVHIGYITY